MTKELPTKTPLLAPLLLGIDSAVYLVLKVAGWTMCHRLLVGEHSLGSPLVQTAPMHPLARA